MEKDQLDSLATVVVGSEKIPPAHSHYAASEVYSASESPPAYTRPPIKSTAVQIAAIIATTMITISIIIGSFILASAWLQARASCSLQSVAAMEAQINSQQSQNEFIKHLQPEALVQDRDVAKESLQHLSDSSSSTDKDEIRPDTKDIKIPSDGDNNRKPDNDNGDQNDSDDDYDDPEFPPVHIKLPLQLDLDDLAGSLLQQAGSIVSCVVERRRSDEVMDGENDHAMNSNSTEHQRIQRLSGERIAILCESGEPRPQQQEQEMLTPIIIPLGTVQIPLQPQDGGYNRYQVHNQYQVSKAQHTPIFDDTRGMNTPAPVGILSPELRIFPRVSMEMRPPPHITPQPHTESPQPIEMRTSPDPMHGAKPSMEQDQFIRERQQQHIPITFARTDHSSIIYPQEQQTLGMMLAPLPPSSQSVHGSQQQITEPRIPPMMIPRQVGHRQVAESEEAADGLDFPFRRIPIELRRIIQQVPLEIGNIIERITGGTRSIQTPVPDGARREQVQEFKPFPEGIQPIRADPFALPIEVRNLLEHRNVEGYPQGNSHQSEHQQYQAKPFTGSEDENEETERKFPIPANVMNIIHQIVEGRALPVPRFQMALGPMESLEVPVEAQAQVSGNQATDEQTQQQEEQENMPQQQHYHARMIVHREEMQNEANRPHFVQPRSVNSAPEPFVHPREKRVRRCACNCAC